MSEEPRHPFVTYLESKCDDRGALAALRRGLGQEPGTVPDMYPYVVPMLPASASRAMEATYYLLASLFAYHPDPGGAGNMGHHFRRAGGQDPDQAIERRFTALLAAHREDLPFYLRQAVSFLRSKDVPVNWHALFFDVLHWHYEDRRVQKRWAAAFWGAPAQSQASTEEPASTQ